MAWHDAVRDRDLQALAALMHSNVEVSGPKGSGHGADLILEWVEVSGIGLEIESFLQRGLTFVVGQAATWPEPDAEGSRREPVAVASVFVVHGARISKVLRFDDVDAALEASGLRGDP